MAEPPDQQPEVPAAGLEERVAAIEQFLATHQSPAPTKSKVFFGGMVIHLPGGRSVGFTFDDAPRAGVAAAAGILVFGVLFLCLRRLRGPHKSQKPRS